MSFIFICTYVIVESHEQKPKQLAYIQHSSMSTNCDHGQLMQYYHQ